MDRDKTDASRELTGVRIKPVRFGARSRARIARPRRWSDIERDVAVSWAIENARGDTQARLPPWAAVFGRERIDRQEQPMGSKHRERDDYVRARTAAEKEDRKRRILSAAAEIVLGDRWQDFTIGTLARKSGVAKGTIYLYFETKSDVLNALFMEHLDAWAEKMLEACHGEMTESEFTDIFWSCTYSDELLMKLLIAPPGAQLPNPDREFDSAQERARLLTDVALLVEDCLELPSGAGSYAVTSLYALLIGSAQVDPALMTKLLGHEDHRYDRELHCEEMFRCNAPGIIAASRNREAKTS